jgi:hypothetical protein
MLTPWMGKGYPQLLENNNVWIGMIFFFNFDNVAKVTIIHKKI